MTKVVILGEQPKEEKKTPIEFVKWIREEGSWDTSDASGKPTEWKFIFLIAKNWRGLKIDLMIASDYEDMRNGCLVLGHFNDGVV